MSRLIMLPLALIVLIAGCETTHAPFPATATAPAVTKRMVANIVESVPIACPAGYQEMTRGLSNGLPDAQLTHITFVNYIDVSGNNMKLICREGIAPVRNWPVGSIVAESLK